MQSATKGLGNIVNEVVGEVIRFPVWWYSAGLVHTIKTLFGVWRNYARRLAVGVWARNILVPMYGQYNFQGRLISVFIRSVQIFIRSLLLFFAALIILAVFALYAALPIISITMVIFHLTGGIFSIL
jgi:hypothetical protein